MMRVYSDSMIWIYALESNVQFGSAAQALLKSVRVPGHKLLTSHLLLGEILVAPAKTNDLATMAAYRKMLTGFGSEVVPFSADVAFRFARLRAQFRKQPADSMHLALAAGAGADIFVTGDAALCRLTIPGIGQVVDLTYRLP